MILPKPVMPISGTPSRPLYPQMYEGAEFAAKLMSVCDWFSGVPDSVMQQVIPHLRPYQFAPRENHAVAMAFGARVGGRRPCVLLQNSGLGLCGDALYGLQHLYGLGMVVVVVARGELAWEEPRIESADCLGAGLLPGREIGKTSSRMKGRRHDDVGVFALKLLDHPSDIVRVVGRVAIEGADDVAPCF